MCVLVEMVYILTKLSNASTPTDAQELPWSKHCAFDVPCCSRKLFLAKLYLDHGLSHLVVEQVP